MSPSEISDVPECRRLCVSPSRRLLRPPVSPSEISDVPECVEGCVYLQVRDC